MDGFFSLFIVIFVIAAGIILFTMGKGIAEWANNNRKPVLTDMSKAVAKRTHVWGGGNNTSASTSYFITFEFENGERHEFAVKSKQYGMIAEDDVGLLTYQGTRFHDFERTSFS